MRQAQNVRRWLYRGRRAHRLARLANRFQARLAAAGLGPAQVFVLDVPGWRTGRTASFPVVVAEYEGERYLVSMLGERSTWVRNVRAAEGRAVLRHGREETVHLVEVEPDRRAPILRRYMECAPGARSHFPVDRRDPLEKFEEIAARFPVFHVSASPPQARGEPQTE